ncbi:MAG: 50S ribosomal protein L29 [Prevotellaceae bacterium]|jgi:large subunit ribosomal protein L29|nr:50S ribosomal protein L29 [Prevotellaceae bacterium]
MKTAEIKEMTAKEILEKVELERAQVAKMRLNHAISPLENPVKLKESRKNIARMLTILRQRELNETKK